MKHDGREKEIKARKELFWGIFGIVLTISLIILGISFNNRLNFDFIQKFGLAGLFIFAFIASGPSSITPVAMPYWIGTMWLPSLLAPIYGIWAAVWVMLVSAIATTLGQFLTYMIGYSGSGISKKLSQRISPQVYDEARGWIKETGSKAIFWMTLIPNPINLPMTVAVALLRYPPYKFLLFSFTGLLIRNAILAFSGYYFMDILSSWIEAYQSGGFTASPFFIVALVLAGVLLAICIWQLIIWMLEVRDKNRKYRAAIECAKKNGKPLLVVGGPWGVKSYRRMFNKPAHGNGDVCLDIDRRAVEGHPCAVVASCTSIPFSDKMFGAVFSSHVLEHMPTTQAAKQALEEMCRVAGTIFIAYPSRQSIAAWIIRDHHIWIWQKGQKTHLKQRKDRVHREHLVIETANRDG
ncbi:MAG: VTT domain-containing protein [Dehalococcoidales bacterium]|nr:VTT domain-containing protein [Dehalococcoidales bacterium]